MVFLTKFLVFSKYKISWNLCALIYALHIALKMEKSEVILLCTCVSLKRNRVQMNMNCIIFKFKWQERQKQPSVYKHRYQIMFYVILEEDIVLWQ